MPKISELRRQKQEVEMLKANPGHIRKEEGTMHRERYVAIVVTVLIRKQWNLQAKTLNLKTIDELMWHEKCTTAFPDCFLRV